MAQSTEEKKKKAVRTILLVLPTGLPPYVVPEKVWDYLKVPLLTYQSPVN